MERIESINPQRVAWCCDDRGITLDQLGLDIGVPSATLEKLVSGEPSLTFNQLRRLAKYFGRGVLFFLDEANVTEGSVRTPQFRTLAQQKPEMSASIKALIERVEHARDVFLSLKEELDNPNLPTFVAPDLPRDVPRAAQVARRWLGLSGRNDFDNYRMAVEAKGIFVVRTNGYAGDWQIPKESSILGFSIFDAVCPVIVVRKQNFESPQSFTLMHELGHILLHKESSIDDVGDLFSNSGHEREANLFAGHVLVPDDFLNAIEDDSRPGGVEAYDEWLRPSRQQWGVSTEVILRRLKDAGRLSAELYTEYRTWSSNFEYRSKEGGSRAYRHREPVHIFGDPFVRVVFDALNSRRITLTRATRYLDHIKVSDLHQLEKLYAGA